MNKTDVLSAKRRRQRGNAMLEFAIGSSVLVAVFTGTFQFGCAFVEYNKLENSVSQAAKYASLQPYASSTTTPPAALLTAVQNMVVYGQPTTGTTPILPSLATSEVNLTVTFTTGVPSAMTVSVNGYVLNTVVSSVTLNNKPQVTYAYQGIYAP